MDVDQVKRSRRAWDGFVVVLIAVAFIASVFGSIQVVGHLTVSLLRRLDSLSPDAYPPDASLLAEPALWLLSATYCLPLVLLASFVPSMRLLASGWSLRHVVDVALVVLAWFSTFGTLFFAFDPSKGGAHEPLVLRWDQISYEAADVVFAATSVMGAMAAVLTVVSWVVPSRHAKLTVNTLAFVGLTAAIGTAFS